MSWEPKGTRELRAELFEVDDIILSSTQYWNRIISREVNEDTGVIDWVGEEMDSGAQAAMHANPGDFRTLGW